ncbi:hypothetical protein LOTGIDRAFT_158090 [Lottia gigantea]|uniref:Uncharacterized protein n=1 Tax=Lottia gigantea TaxID=225164 RepID=V4AY17_LOTGI|nr:hypothetical protein LOTGIDRAFT_158090 [Lottia gigantea]ESO99930.1 hypothetical protein LOTGIDRAFT_158090 [Lottia gigantea]
MCFKMCLYIVRDSQHLILHDIKIAIMLTWLKKRCRRNSAPSGSNKKSRSCIDPDVTPPFYFELEDDSLSDHDYEEVPDCSPESYATYYLAKEITSLTQELVTDLSNVDLCPTCRRNCSTQVQKANDSLCSCYAQPIDPIYSKATAISSYAVLPRCFAEYDLPTSSPISSQLYSRINIEKKRKLFRSRSDIRRRPLPELPVRREADDDVTYDGGSESSGFYEIIDSDEDNSLIGVGPGYMSESILV